MRTALQTGFLALTLIGVFVVVGNAEAWCPFGGLEGLYTYFKEGNLPCSLAVSNFYALAAVLVLTLLFRRAFCGYVCPIGTISDWVRRGAARLGVASRAVPPRLDQSLSTLKYLVLGLILYFTYRSAELVFRGFDPCYALISRHGEDITLWAYAIAAVILLLSLVLTMPFCRWLCPLAAALHPFSRFGVARIKRLDAACVQCGECATACPMAIPVHERNEVRDARCISCLSCLDACPRQDRTALVWGPPDGLGGRWPHGVLPAAILTLTATAVTASTFFALPSFTSRRGEPAGDVATVDLEIEGLTCRGRAVLLTYFLERDDAYALPDFVELRAWPAPGVARAVVRTESSSAIADEVKRAITEPYFDAAARTWRSSPFTVRGFDPLDDEKAAE